MPPNIVGKSSGWVGPVNEYARNVGTVGRRKVVFIGASYKFVHRVVRDLILVGGFEDVELCIHDIDAEPLRIVGDLVERIARQQETRIRVTRTLDRREALRGADVALLSITTGGKEADCRSFEVCAKYGIPVGVGDTLGPPALARNLREVPVVLQIIRDMEELCPHGLMLNFTNPMSVITGAMARHSSLPVWGLCHSGDGLCQYFADLFGVKKSALALTLAGVNHQSFVLKLLIDGADRTADLLPQSLKRQGGAIADALTGAHDEVRLQQDLCRVLGCWPSRGADHLAEFYRYFYTPRRIEQLGLHRHLKRVVPGRQPFGRTPCPQILLDWAYGPEAVGDLHLLTEEHAHELMWSFFMDQPFTRSLNVLNTEGWVAGLPRDACVELMATVQGRKVTATPVTLPPALHATVLNWVTIHDLSLRAARNCDRQAACQALFLDPHVRDFYDIEPFLEDLLAATKPWLPAGWFAGN